MSWTTKLRALLLAAVAGAAFAAAVGSAVSEDAGGTRLTWMVTGSNAQKVANDRPALAAYGFDTPRGYLTGNEDGTQVQVPAGLPAAVPTLKYESYARFESDLRAGRISRSIRAVIYDPENWDATPAAERKDPYTYLRRFSRLAKASGYIAITTPARDLMLVSGARCGKRAGETLSAAYIRCNVQGAAAQYADITQVQSQSEQFDLPRLRDLVSRTRAQALAANPGVVFTAGLSTSPWSGVATADQLFAAHGAVEDLVRGYYFTICAGCPGELTVAEDFLEMVRAAGD